MATLSIPGRPMRNPDVGTFNNPVTVTPSPTTTATPSTTPVRHERPTRPVRPTTVVPTAGGGGVVAVPVNPATNTVVAPESAGNGWTLIPNGDGTYRWVYGGYAPTNSSVDTTGVPFSATTALSTTGGTVATPTSSFDSAMAWLQGNTFFASYPNWMVLLAAGIGWHFLGGRGRTARR